MPTRAARQRRAAARAHRAPWGGAVVEQPAPVPVLTRAQVCAMIVRLPIAVEREAIRAASRAAWDRLQKAKEGTYSTGTPVRTGARG